MANEAIPLSSEAMSIKPGEYKHFKGGLYTVLDIGRLSEDHAQEMVIYKSHDTGQTWLRPVKMFLENVDRDGYKGPRFTKLED